MRQSWKIWMKVERHSYRKKWNNSFIFNVKSHRGQFSFIETVDFWLAA